jgi:cytochrome P450
MLIEIILLLLGLIALLYWYITKNYNHFKDRDLPHGPPSFPFGSELSKELVLRKRHLFEVLKDEAKKTKGKKFYGTYFFKAEMLVLQDPEVIKTILVKDFQNFTDRQAGESPMAKGTETDKMWSKQLVMSNGDKWKQQRSTFSPIFNSGKMKLMMNMLNAVCDDMTKFIEKSTSNDEDIELKDLFRRYTMGSILNCTFGVESDSFNEQDTPLSKTAKGISAERTGMEIIKFLAMMFPGGSQLFRLFRISIFRPVETRFIYDMVQASIKARKESGQSRNDLVDLAIRAIDGIKDAKHEEGGGEDQDEQFEKDAVLNYKPASIKVALDDTDICASAMVFLVAGFDTTNNALAFAAYELAMNPDAQQKLRKEIDSVSDVNYSTIQNLEYLDMVVHETLRKWPLAALLRRAALNDYQMPDSSYVLAKGKTILINVTAVHYNEEWYPEPEKFIPERFSKEEKAKRHP